MNAYPYECVVPPVHGPLATLPLKVVRGYAAWFHAAMPERLTVLTHLVRSNYAFLEWPADHSVESLRELWDWFPSEVSAKEEPSRLQIRSVEIVSPTPTARTLSLCIDVGMYFGATFVKNVPDTAWVQPVKNRRYVDFGSPCICRGGVERYGLLNPVGIALTLANSIICGAPRPGGFERLFRYWERALGKSAAELGEG